jgi:hypothetical protein
VGTPANCASATLGIDSAINAIVLREFKLSKTRTRDLQRTIWPSEERSEGIENPMSKGTMMLLFEGVAFAVGLLLLAGSTYLVAVDALRRAKQTQ